MTVSRVETSVTVVVPAFNEEETIGDLISRLHGVGRDYEVIVVDDGSSDATAEKAEKTGALIIRNPYNVGNGASVKKGILAATGDIVVMMDADGQHPPEEVPKLVEMLGGGFDMVVATRTHRSDTSLIRNFGNKLLNTIASWICGYRIPDLTSGFRAIRRDPLLQYVHMFPSRYSYPTTITLSMLMGAHFVRFHPVDTIGRRKTGSSNISPARDFVRFVAIIFRMIMLFRPARIFVPVAALLFLASIAVSVWQYVGTGGVQSAGLALFLTSIFIACFGLLADQIAVIRRR